MYKIRECVTEEAAKTIVHALVISKLDHCNSLLYGLPDVSMVTISGKYQQISPTMEKLHWLPIWQCIDYNVLLLTYNW